jgi:hypothetical protein
MRAVEHITLDGEADGGPAPAPQAPLATLRRYRVPGQFEGHYTELSILESHYLRVRTVGARGGARDYQLDLRFADPAPMRVRRIPWTWLLLAGGLAAAGLGALAAIWPALAAALGWDMVAGVIAALTGAVAIHICLRWTKESLELRSLHGAATLVSVTGRLGSARRHQEMFAEFARHAVAARLARPQDKPQLLRDEMREHYRLRQLGVLSDQAYEAAKAAILAAH